MTKTKTSALKSISKLQRFGAFKFKISELTDIIKINILQVAVINILQVAGLKFLVKLTWLHTEIQLWDLFNHNRQFHLFPTKSTARSSAGESWPFTNLVANFHGSLCIPPATFSTIIVTFSLLKSQGKSTSHYNFHGSICIPLSLSLPSRQLQDLANY